MDIPLEKGPASIIFYPTVHREVNEEEIWKEERSGVTTDKGLGLYIHIPFCMDICPFCPFVKYLWREKKEEAYVEALEKEMALYSRLSLVKENDITTVYFGGGTPTALTTDRLVELLDHVAEKFSVAPNAEIAIETHPLTTLEDKLSRIRERGVNRITIGIQSLTEDLLRILGCSHNVKEAIRAIETVKEIGFESIGIDLFYRIPTQKMGDWKKALEIAVEYGLDHISCYNLGVYPGTLFHKSLEKGKIPGQPDQDVGVDMYRFAKTYLEECGYKEYTVANFAKDGKRCLYIRLTLEAPQGEYLGLGASSFEYANDFHSYKVSSLERYIEELESDVIPYSKGTLVSKKEKMARYMVLGTGCLGVSKGEFKKRFGIEIKEVYGDIINDLEKWDLVGEDESAIRLTETGIDYAVSIARLFFTDAGGGLPQGARVT